MARDRIAARLGWLWQTSPENKQKEEKMIRAQTVAAMFFCATGGLATAGEIEDRLKSLIEQGQYSNAYATAQENQDRHGNPDFDYLLGLAAIESGRAGDGVLALERVRAARPGDDVAWFHLARGYFLLGEAERARSEFSAMLDEGVQEPLAGRVKEWLDLASARETERTGATRFYVEGGVGHDTNANAGIGTNSVDLSKFGFGAYVPTDRVREMSDTRYSVGAGGQYSRLIGAGMTAFSGADLSQLAHSSHDNLDQTSLGAYAGLAMNRGGQQWRFTASANTLWLESDRYRTVGALSGEWTTAISNNQSLTAYAQYMRFDYIGTGNTERDSNLWGIGVGYRHVMTGDWRPVLTASIGYADERNARNRDDYSRNIWNLSAGISFSPLSRLRVGVNYALQDSPYRAPDPILLATRKDLWQNLSLNATYALSDKLSVRGDLSWMTNGSNIDLYDYDRAQFNVKLRYDFR